MRRIIFTRSSRGIAFGQYLSGMARAYAVTGSKPTRDKVERLVKGFGATVEPSGKFYVDYRLPAYTFDKTCCGLIDAHEYVKDPNALPVLKRATEAVMPHLPEKALSRAEQERGRIRRLRIRGTRPTRCRRICFWRISAAPTSATKSSRSGSSITNTTMRWRKITMRCRANTHTAT